MEEASPSDLELEKNMGTVGECAGAGGDDECAQAANIYQCGRDKAPAVTNAMQAAVITNGGNDDSAEVSIFFPAAAAQKCPVLVSNIFWSYIEKLKFSAQISLGYSKCSDS